MPESICELVRKNESEYIRGSTRISKYVTFSMHDTIAKAEAYLHSTHINGDTDGLGREKPFFNISVAAANIWYRATDIDRRHIRIRATKMKDWLDTFVATVHLRDWMRRENYGAYLNEWGRILARYGSAVTKFVQTKSALHIRAMPWNVLICDPVDFESNPKIEILELTEAQLWARVTTHGYSAAGVRGLMDAITERETLDKQRKDNKTGYIRLYEVHGNLPVSMLKRAKNEEVLEGDSEKYTQQMEVVAYVNTKTGRKTQYSDFCVYAGKEEFDPFEIDHLIKEDGRSLAIGAVEHLFEVQWMQNHAVKTEKDTLDLASRLMFQTADASFLNMNILDNMESGDILIHGSGTPLTQINTGKYDVSQMMNFRQSWKNLGNEITGISEAMLGIQAKSGTAWRQTEASLGESYSLFELMTENKGLAIERHMRTRILPYVRTKMDSKEEVSDTLEAHDITRIDSIFLKPEAIKRTNKQIVSAIDQNLERISRKESVLPIDAGAMFEGNMQQLQESMSMLGNQRFFKPSDISSKTWKEQFKDLEWEVEVDITGENADTQGQLETLYTALKTVVLPGFAQNKKAQAIVGRILELTGAMSPIEYAALPEEEPTADAGAGAAAKTSVPTPDLSREGDLQTSERNI